MLESTGSFGKFEFRPLEPGYATTIGNPLRRILWSSLEGFAITGIHIQGVDHEFATIPGVIEDVTEIILNLKKVRFKRKIEDTEGEKITLIISGQETFTAGDFNRVMNNFEVLNPKELICNMDPSITLEMEITIQKGRGYVTAADNLPENVEIGFIPVDAIFTPIRNTNYYTVPYRVEGKTDYDSLLIEIETDGSITPIEALKEAAKILIYHFMLFSDEKIALETEDHYGNDEFDEEILHMRQLLKTRLVDMDLSVRALNCLKSAEVETLGELVQFNKNDLLKFRNFGKKSLTELEALLEANNLEFGMDVAKYKLDKE